MNSEAPRPSLLATKLHRPALPPTWVERPYLGRRLDQGLRLDRRITLVSAPPGFGKTSAISEWVATLKQRSVTWLSLDPADDDPGRLFAYLIAALQKIDRDIGREIAEVWASGRLPAGEVVSAALINDILTVPERFLLVLDDVHVLRDRYILGVLEHLVTNLPRPLHLVLITREDPPLPLARLRANNRLTEIRARDLRFTAEDAARFLNETMDLDLSGDEIAALEAKTEGWIAGLQLAAIAMRNARPPEHTGVRSDASAFIAALSGSHRYILSYLTEQVLDRQPDEIRHFLLQTSILDKLTGELCDALTGRSGGRGMLERLYSANLFLIPLDDEGRWYRYHHLFADLLRDLRHTHLTAEPSELHRRAGRWYAQAGAAFASEAIEHALRGDDFAFAVNLLEDHAMDLIMQGYAKTVNGWVQRLPADWNAQSPKTHIAFAWMHLLRGAYAEATPHMELVRAAFTDAGTTTDVDRERAALKAEWLVMQALRRNLLKEATESRRTATRALELAPESDGRVRGLAFFALGSACQLQADAPAATAAYREAIRLSRAAGSLIADMLSTAALGLMAFEQGQLHLTHEIATPVAARVARAGEPAPIRGVVSGLLAEVCYQWYRLDEARQHAKRTHELSLLGGYNSGIASCHVLLSRLAQIEQDLETAEDEIRRAADSLRTDGPENLRQEVVAQQVSVYLAQQRPAAARMALSDAGFSFRDELPYPDRPPDKAISYTMGLIYAGSLRFRLYQARATGDPAALRAGVDLATDVIAVALEAPYPLIALQAHLLRAQMRAALGDPAHREDYVEALKLGEREGFVAAFVEEGGDVAEAIARLSERGELAAVDPAYVRRILSAFSAAGVADETTNHASPKTQPLVEPLTDRELEVLRLIAAGLKYKEIAARLFISLNTVRYHVKEIYGKLQVNNRSHAAKKARRLHLL